MSEQYSNFAQSSTTGAINNSSNPVTFNVQSGDGAKFPSTTNGSFRVVIDSEIMLCTARSTDTLTCTRAQEGTTIAGHQLGAAVYHNFTAGAMDTIRSNISQMGTYANLPSTSVAKSGDRYRQTDGPFEYMFNGSVWVPFFPSYGQCYLPNSANYSLVGTGSADIHTFTDKGRIRIVNGGSGQGDSFYNPTSTNVPASGDFRIRAVIRQIRHLAGGDTRLGVYLLDTTSSKAVSYHYAGQNTSALLYWTNITTPTLSSTKTTSGRMALNDIHNGGGYVVLHLSFQSGSLFFGASGSGNMFPAENAYSATDFLPNRPTKAGLYVGEHSSLVCGMEILSFEVEQGTGPSFYWTEFGSQTLTGL